MNVGLEIEDETYMHVGHVNDYALIVSIYLVRPLKRYGSYIWYADARGIKIILQRC